jgi:uncharacterized linocin/CFP29 family protein
MNNLHRELAPISDAAWAQIEEETSRTLKRYLAGRRVVDVQGPEGTGLSAVGTGHLSTIPAPREGIISRQREVKALVELRVPFDLNRQAIDDVERGGTTPTGNRQRTPPARSPLPKTTPSSRAIRLPASKASIRGQAIRS